MSFEIKCPNVVFETLNERRDIISGLVAESNETRILHELDGGTEVHKIRVPINYLSYRIENYRTSTIQCSYIAKNHYASDWFNGHSEDQLIQDQQHAFLVKLAYEGKGDTVIPIITALEADKRQRDPFIISSVGTVVNGNRRLAAFRELLADDESGTYDKLRYAECLVLPQETTDVSTKLLEVAIQMAPRTDLDYDWTSEGFGYRELRDKFDLKSGQIANQAGGNISAKKVTERIRMIEEADIYLDRYLDDAGNYEMIQDSEEAFKQLSIGVNKCTSLNNKERLRALIHPIINRGDDLKTRVYNFVSLLKDKTMVDAVYEEFTDDTTISDIIKKTDATEQSPSIDNGVDVFDGLVDEAEVDGNEGTDKVTRSKEAIAVEVLNNIERRDEVFDTLKEALEEVYDQAKRGIDQNAPVRSIRSALSKLTPLHPSQISSEIAEKISVDLEQIIEKAGELKEAVNTVLTKE